MNKIFISYRREDSPASAGRLYDKLEQIFGREKIFYDIDNIDVGADFEREIRVAIEKTAVFILIIGKQWASVKKPNGSRRLDDPDDFVRQEIRLAMKTKIKIIPVFVNNGSMPGKEELPDDIAGIRRIQGHTLSHTNWNSEVEKLRKIIAKEIRGNSIWNSLFSKFAENVSRHPGNKSGDMAKHSPPEEGAEGAKVAKTAHRGVEIPKHENLSQSFMGRVSQHVNNHPRGKWVIIFLLPGIFILICGLHFAEFVRFANENYLILGVGISLIISSILWVGFWWCMHIESGNLISEIKSISYEQSEGKIKRKGEIIRRLSWLGLKLPDLPKICLVKADLQGADFKNSNLRGAFFQKAKLQGADFRNCDLRGAFFQQANLQMAIFDKALLDDATFNAADLHGVQLIAAQLRGTDFENANLNGANFSKARKLTKKQVIAGAITKETTLPSYLPIEWEKEMEFRFVK